MSKPLILLALRTFPQKKLSTGHVDNTVDIVD